MTGADPTQTSARPTVRIVCLDRDGRLLLGAWRDHVDGTVLWELPGGGIELGESPREAAQRELLEETGLRSTVGETTVRINRDVSWLGVHYRSVEPCFVLRDVAHEDVDTLLLMADEVTTFEGYRWVSPSSIRDLAGRLENPDLRDIVGHTAPDSIWAS